MGKTTGIAWTTHTFNPWWGCTKVDPLCDNCYAEEWAKRWGYGWGEDATRRTFGDKHWAEPRAWNAAAQRAGERRRVFCASMADVFDKDAPPGELDRLWALICATPWLDWQLLTKRANRIAESLPADWNARPWPNVWLGVSVGTVKGLWRVKALREIPAVVRFISYEPALELIDFAPHLDGIDWLIGGAESGDGRRPMSPEMERAARDACGARGVKFFFKQRVDDKGKKISLPLLDGRQWAEFPLPGTRPIDPSAKR